MKRKRVMVTSYGCPPICSRCRKKATCKVLKSGRMVCFKKSFGHKLRRVM